MGLGISPKIIPSTNSKQPRLCGGGEVGGAPKHAYICTMHFCVSSKYVNVHLETQYVYIKFIHTCQQQDIPASMYEFEIQILYTSRVSHVERPREICCKLLDDRVFSIFMVC